MHSYSYYHFKDKRRSGTNTIIKSSSFIDRIKYTFSKENITTSYTYNRWLIPPAALSIHMSIGSVYAWSIFNSPLTRELGVVASAPGININNIYLTNHYKVHIKYNLDTLLYLQNINKYKPPF